MSVVFDSADSADSERALPANTPGEEETVVDAINVLFLSDNFPPESNAPALRTFEHAKEWVAQGHRVTVITCAPNFPAGRLYPGYRNRWYAREWCDGIEVIRVKTFIAANEGVVSRIFDFLSFMVSGTVAAVVQPRPDVVLATSPQLFAAVAGRLVGWLKRRPFIMEVRDLWPASIIAVGAMREGPLIRAMVWLEGRLYRSADAIVIVARSFGEEIEARGVERRRITFVPNAVDSKLFRPLEKDVSLLRQQELTGAFVVGYIGTHGMAHDLENVVEAVERLRDHRTVRFVFVGAGAARAAFEAQIAARGLANVRLVPAQPHEEIVRWLSICDVALIPLRASPVFAGVVPSKLFECQATGTPVVMSVPRGEATELVEASGCGVVVPPEDPRELAAAIERLAADPDTCMSMREAGLLAASKGSRSVRALEMLEVIDRVRR